MLVPLILLSGCMHHQPRMNKRSYHLNVQTADDSRLIDDIRVSSKKAHYDKKTDCTLVKLTVENRSHASCSFRPSDLNMPLISQDQAERLLAYSGRDIARIIGFASVGATASFCSLIFPTLIMLVPGAFYFSTTIWRCIVVGTPLAGMLFGASRANYKTTKMVQGFDYMSRESKKKVIFSGEIQTVLLLVKGQQIHDLSVALQTDNGLVDYVLRLPISSR